MKKFISPVLLLVFVLSVNKVSAQQNSLFNTYKFDPLQLNIAYAGAACTEANVHYRKQWLGMQGTPQLIQLNAHTALGSSNAIALKINSQNQGLLNTLGATLGYSYRIPVNETAKVHLGIGLGFSQAALQSQKATVIDGNDITLNNGNRQTANGFDSELGAMYINDKLKAGISALHLYSSNPDFTGTSTYKKLPQLNAQLSYIFNKDKKIEIEPSLLNRYTLKGNNIIEGMLHVNFIKTITIGAGYRSGYGFLALLGAKIGNLKLAYSFDYGATKNATNLGTSHQVMLGFSMCKSKPSKLNEEVSPITASITPVAPTPTTEPVVVKEDPKIEEPVVVKEEPKIDEAAEKLKREEATINELNIICEGLIFDANKATLPQEKNAKLKELAEIIIKNNLSLTVVGYASRDGESERNKILSINRANFVKQELIKHGVKQAKIKHMGLGDSKELYDNNDQNLKYKNRTFRVIKGN